MKMSTFIVALILFSTNAISASSKDEARNAPKKDVDVQTYDRMQAGLYYACVLLGQGRDDDAKKVIDTLKVSDKWDTLSSEKMFYFFNGALREAGIYNATRANCYKYASVFLGGS